MALRQVLCPEVAAMRASTTLTVTSRPVKGLLYGDTSTGTFRPLVPASLRRAVFDVLHNSSHPEMRATRRLISSRFVWPGLSKQVSAWAREGLSCQRAKMYRHIHLQAAPIPLPRRRFAHIHVDLVGPLSPSKGFTYLFTIIDRTTRWPEVVPLSSITASDCAEALFSPRRL